MKPRSTSVRTRRTRRWSPTSYGCPSTSSLPSVGGCQILDPRPLRRGAGHHRVEPAANPPLEQQRGRGFADRALHFRGVVLLLGTVRRDRHQIAVAVRPGLARKGGLDQPLRHDVGKTAIRRRGVRIRSHGESEVAGRGVAGDLGHVLASAEQLQHGERQHGKVLRIGLAPIAQELGERLAVGPLREASAVVRCKLHEPRPSLRRADDAPQGRRAVPLEEPRDHPVGGDHELLDERARPVALARLHVEHLAVREHRLRLVGLELERAMLVAQHRQAPRGRVLQPQIAVEPRNGADAGRRRRCIFEPGADLVVRQLRVIADDGAIDVAAGDRARVVHERLDDDRQPVLVRIERRQVGREAGRQHRKDLRFRVHRGRVPVCVAVERRAEIDRLGYVRDGDPDARRTAGGLGTR